MAAGGAPASEATLPAPGPGSTRDPLAPVLSGSTESAADPARSVGRVRSLFLDTTPLRLDRDYRLLWSGQVISGFGRQVTVVALPYQLYVLTGSPLAIGLLALVQLVPL